MAKRALRSVFKFAKRRKKLSLRASGVKKVVRNVKNFGKKTERHYTKPAPSFPYSIARPDAKKLSKVQKPSLKKRVSRGNKTKRSKKRRVKTYY